MITPWDAVTHRVAIDYEIGEDAHCDSLFKAFEFTIKYTTSLLLALLPEQDPFRYQWEYYLVRASSLGHWERSLRKIATGRSYSQISNSLSNLGRMEALEDLTTKTTDDAWQYQVSSSISRAIATITNSSLSVPRKYTLMDAFSQFITLRNKTAHGAPTSETRRKLVIHLNHAFTTLSRHLQFVNLPLVLYQKTSNDERPTVVSTEPLTQEDYTSLQRLLSDSSQEPGLFIFDQHGRPFFHRVSLLHPDTNSEDFYTANGAYRTRDENAEWLSYSTGKAKRLSIKSWMIKPPVSETSAYDNLVPRGESFTNAPDVIENYVNRPELEEELIEALRYRKNPMITLNGRGGIGKTSVALWAVSKACQDGWFDIILWFSARDIDLTEMGALNVYPDVVSLRDIVQRARQLLEELGTSLDRLLSPEQLLETIIHDDQTGHILWVLDNFETVDRPKDIFDAFDSCINSAPNDHHKVLITTRHRPFQGDHRVQVDGMSYEEFDILIQRETLSLRLPAPLSAERVEELFRTTYGHPYVAKITLGELKRGRFKHTKRILQSMDDILTPLFERTVDILSPSSRHVYLLLCRWNSLIPFVALDLAINSEGDSRIDIYDTTEELIDFSLISTVYEDDHNEDWVWFDVPTPARIFGRRRIQADPLRLTIDVEARRLQRFGVSSPFQVGRREQYVRRFWESIRSELHIARRVGSIYESLGDKWYTWFDRLGTSVPRLWTWLAQEMEDRGRASEADKYYVRAIQSANRYPDISALWLDLARYREEQNRDKEALQAWVGRAGLPDAPFADVSHAANKVNGWLSRQRVQLAPEERQSVVSELIGLMEYRATEADAQDLSRLAWLYANIGELGKAVDVAKRGLKINPGQRDCRNVLRRFGS